MTRGEIAKSSGVAGDNGPSHQTEEDDFEL